MRKELKKAIIDYMFENLNHHQLVNSTTTHFRQYIYTEKGDYCIGGKDVSDFIDAVEKLLKSF